MSSSRAFRIYRFHLWGGIFHKIRLQGGVDGSNVGDVSKLKVEIMTEIGLLDADDKKELLTKVLEIVQKKKD